MVAGPLIRQCCEAFLASLKVHRFGTVGGNLCLSYPAAPMISLTAALHGVCTIWTPDGSDLSVPVADFVTGNCINMLQPGEVLRSILLPAAALESRTAFRKIALSPLGRSGAVIIGRRDGTGLEITLTASTVRPVLLAFDAIPGAAELVDAFAALPDIWHDDPHGPPDWRAQVSAVLAEQIRVELAAPTPAASEEMMIDADGKMITNVLRQYHIPQLADVPRTEVYFAATTDKIGPLGAKSMSESPYNPVAPALANAIRDAIGVRLYELPMSRDRVWRAAAGR